MNNKGADQSARMLVNAFSRRDPIIIMSELPASTQVWVNVKTALDPYGRTIS